VSHDVNQLTYTEKHHNPHFMGVYHMNMPHHYWHNYSLKNIFIVYYPEYWVSNTGYLWFQTHRNHDLSCFRPSTRSSKLGSQRLII